MTLQHDDAIPFALATLGQCDTKRNGSACVSPKVDKVSKAVYHRRECQIRLGIYVFVNKARGGGNAKFFINTL